MKEYIKPYIEDEEIEIEDICNASSGGAGDSDKDGLNDPYSDLFD